MALDELKLSLLRRLSDRGFHSGRDLAAAFGVSRSAVWKHLREMEALGLQIAAVPGRGYRMLTPLELLDPGAIRANLAPGAAALMGGLQIHDLIDSTNSHLMRSAASGLALGTVCLAETQTGGRGRIGRDWVSPFGANIYLSVLWGFEEPSRLGGLSLAVGVAVARVLGALGFAEIGLKWPNDILWGDRKLGGILLEVAGEVHGHCTVVVGLGLNRYLPGSAALSIDQPWADLFGAARGRALPSRNVLAASLLNELLPLLSAYAVTGLAPFLDEWRHYHRFGGRAAVVHQGDSRISGRIADVTAAGLLVLQCEDGRFRQFASGDVRLKVAE